MSGYGLTSAGAYANQAKVTAIRPARKIRKQKVKLTFKQRIRNWLNSDEYEQDVPQLVEADRLSSEGMRMQIYKASGGYVVETRSYDNHKDRHHNTMHVITEDQDLGDCLGKIVMMEALKR
jgi:hypothetical protein